MAKSAYQIDHRTALKHKKRASQTAIVVSLPPTPKALYSWWIVFDLTRSLSIPTALWPHTHQTHVCCLSQSLAHAERSRVPLPWGQRPGHGAHYWTCAQLSPVKRSTKSFPENPSILYLSRWLFLARCNTQDGIQNEHLISLSENFSNLLFLSQSFSYTQIIIQHSDH